MCQSHGVGLELTRSSQGAFQRNGCAMSSVTCEPLPLVSWVNGEMELAELMTDPDEPEKRSVVWGS